MDEKQEYMEAMERAVRGLWPEIPVEKVKQMVKEGADEKFGTQPSRDTNRTE